MQQPEGIAGASELTRPIFNVLGQDLPRGFFLMVKRGGALVPRITPLDPALLSDDHAYAVRLTEQRVEFFIDGAPVGAFGSPPHGKGVNILQKPVPLLGQAWLDGSYWFPLPIPEYNDREQRLTMTRDRQGPSETTPLRGPRPARWARRAELSRRSWFEAGLPGMREMSACSDIPGGCCGGTWKRCS
ncbi:hypothetical protein ABZ552_07190 [Nocardia sp. NPDC019219]|uniref:hypothetical protein n=1 Tax=Nocardia sp. NPDC019219 TaxID=3154590 RepID=UPI0033EB0A2E